MTLNKTMAMMALSCVLSSNAFANPDPQCLEGCTLLCSNGTATCYTDATGSNECKRPEPYCEYNFMNAKHPYRTLLLASATCPSQTGAATCPSADDTLAGICGNIPSTDDPVYGAWADLCPNVPKAQPKQPVLTCQNAATPSCDKVRDGAQAKCGNKTAYCASPSAPQTKYKSSCSNGDAICTTSVVQ